MGVGVIRGLIGPRCRLKSTTIAQAAPASPFDLIGERD
jgi:hypothetical protein